MTALEVMEGLVTNIELVSEKIITKEHQYPRQLLQQCEHLAKWCDDLIKQGGVQDHTDLTWPWSGRHRENVKFLVSQVNSPLLPADQIKWGSILAGIIYLETRPTFKP